MDEEQDSCLQNNCWPKTAENIMANPIPNLWSAEIRGIADMAARSVVIVLNPTSSSAARAEAQSYYDKIRGDGKPLDIFGVGFMMASECAAPPTVLHAGLHLIQDVVCYNWNTFPNDQRVYLRAMFMDLVKKHTTNGFAMVYSVSYLQEALAKVVVEMAKKEWPQLWPEFLPELKSLPDNTNVPFLVLRRLVEDVVTLQTIDSHDRRTELSQSLYLYAPEVMDFLFEAQKTSHAQYATGNNELKHRICTILSVIYSYFEWVNTSVILTGKRILDLLEMLMHKDFRFHACQCLLQLMERKSTRKEVEVLNEFLTVFSHQCIVESIRLCGGTEDDVKFLRKLGEVLVLIGHHLPLKEQAVDFFGNYVMRLAMQGDAATMVFASQAYINFLKVMDQKIGELDPGFLSRLKELISVICQKFCSPVNPAEKGDMNSLKQNLAYLLKTAGKMDPKFYLCVNNWFHQSLASQTPIPHYQWDVIANILDAVASTVMSEMEDVVQTGLNDLQLAVERFNSETSDIQLKSSYLSVVSALFGFLNSVNEENKFGDVHLGLMNGVFTSIFNCFASEDYSEHQRFLRHHVAALIIKLATKFPRILTLSLDHLHALANAHYKTMKIPERHCVIECVFIVSNTWNDFGRQKSYVERVFQMDEWNQIYQLVNTPEAFLEFLKEPTFTEKKPLLFSNFALLHTALRRIRCMTISVDGKEEKDHSAYEICRHFLPIVSQYVKMVNCLPELNIFVNILDMTDTEKIQVLGIMQAPGASVFNQFKGRNCPDMKETPDTYVESVRKFLHGTLESAYGILGGACPLFTPNLYNIPCPLFTPDLNTINRIQDIYLNRVGFRIETLNDYRVRCILRSVYRPFLVSCPPSASESVLLPFFREFAPYMLEKLSKKWELVTAKNENSDEDDEESEILNSSVLRLLTRDYFEILNRILEMSATKDNTCCAMGSNDMELDEEMDEGQKNGPGFVRLAQTSSTLQELGEFGKILLSDHKCFEAIIHTAGLAMSWSDSGVGYRAVRCAIVAWDYVCVRGDIVLALLSCALRSVCYWIEHEPNVDALIRLIDLIFKHAHKMDPKIGQLLMEWGASEADIRNLSSRCGDGIKNDKMRKELIRKLVKNNPNLERNKVKKSSWIEKLPPLVPPKESTAVSNNSDMDLTSLFGSGDTRPCRS